jgi:hypothetical protein
MFGAFLGEDVSAYSYKALLTVMDRRLREVRRARSGLQSALAEVTSDAELLVARSVLFTQSRLLLDYNTAASVCEKLLDQQKKLGATDEELKKTRDRFEAERSFVRKIFPR